MQKKKQTKNEKLKKIANLFMSLTKAFLNLICININIKENIFICIKYLNLIQI